MESELRAKDNRLNRLFQKFSNESKAVTIASVSLIVSVLSLLMAWSAVNSATNAKAKVDYELRATQQDVTAMKNKITLQTVYLQELYFLMQKKGLEPPPLPGE